MYPYLLRGLTIERPRVVFRHHLHPGAGRVPVPGGDYGLGEPAGAGVAAEQHDGHRVLLGSVDRDPGAARPPEIFNTDQGSQFTSTTFTAALGSRCSMDGRGRCLDNAFIERLWRSLKYEAVYLHELADGFAAQRVIDDWMRSAPALGAGRPHAGRSVSRRWNGTRKGGGPWTQVAPAGCEGIRGRCGARAVEYIHIIHRLVHPLPRPPPPFTAACFSREG